MTHTEAARELRRCGTPQSVIDAMEAELPDPFDMDLFREFLGRYGISRGSLVNDMGGSP